MPTATRLFRVQGEEFGSDLEFHKNLNLGRHWKAMTGEAAAAIANFPPAVL